MATHRRQRHVLAARRLARRRLGPACHPVPQPNRLVVRPARQRVAIRRPSHAAHARHVSDQRVHVLPRGRVPDLDGRVRRRRRDKLAVGRDARLRHGLRVSVQRQPRAVVWLQLLAWRRRLLLPVRRVRLCSRAVRRGAGG